MHGEKLRAQRPAWEAIRKAGGKIFAAGWKDKRKHFEAMGDIQDLMVAFDHPSKELAEKWHSVGHKIVNYGHPHYAGNPEILRRNYGLLLWKYNYDGAMNFAYQHSSGNNIWNDFDHSWGDYSVYPTVDGVIDTIAWEGYREGIDDVRYAITLLKAIEEGKKSKDGRIRQTALSAEEYLEELKKADLNTKDLNVIRLEIINHILNLKKLTK